MTRSKEKATFSIDSRLVEWVDELVRSGEFESRSAVFEQAMRALRSKHEEQSYEQALALLDPVEEQAMAEEGMADYSRLVLNSTEWEGSRERAV